MNTNYKAVYSNHLKMFLNENNCIPVEENRFAAYYKKSEKLDRLIESYVIQQTFKRGGKWER